MDLLFSLRLTSSCFVLGVGAGGDGWGGQRMARNSNRYAAGWMTRFEFFE